MVRLQVSNKRAVPNGTHDCTIVDTVVQNMPSNKRPGETWDSLTVVFQPDGDGDTPFVPVRAIMPVRDVSPLSRLGVMASRLGLVDFEDPSDFDTDNLRGLRCRVPIYTKPGERFPQVETDRIERIPDAPAKK